MKRTICFVLAAILLFCGCGSSGQKTAAEPEQSEEMVETEEVTIFPKSDCFIGDTMPYFEKGYMNVFYLADLRDGKTGYHPWALMRTKDYCIYEDMGIVIPYAEDAAEQDIALGTGCVIKDKDGLYHAFYTGHNDHYAPKEAIMHATSTDMISWTKIPEDTFTAGDHYSQDDFRDPYVFYADEDNCYWMLVVTRSENGGVIARYTSSDLSNWEDQGIFFEDDMGEGTNMECPSLLNFKGKWYLAFSDQWPDRVVHYRVADSVRGPFTKPDEDTVDGNGFYAGRLETDGENLYLVGWNGTKIGHEDENDYDWGGNMVVHQLLVDDDGTLDPIPEKHVVETLSHAVALEPTVITETIIHDSSGYQLSGNGYELVQFDALESDARIEAEVTAIGQQDFFGIGFAPDTENVSALNYVFNIKENRVEFYNSEDIQDMEPESCMNYEFTGKDSLHLTILLGGGVASLFVDDELTLTARMYRSQGTAWQLFGVDSTVKWENVAAYR